MIAETSVDAIGLTTGDRVWARFSGTDQELVPVTITGVVRTPLDLLPLGGANAGPGIMTGPGFLADRRADVPALYGGVAVWLDDDDIDGLTERMQTELDRLVVGFPLVAPDEADTIVQATDFEAWAGLAAAGAAVVVVVFIIGQAVSRQARSEAVDRDTLVTLGLAERDLVAAAALRGRRWPQAPPPWPRWRAPPPRPSVRSVSRGEACGHGPSTLTGPWCSSARWRCSSS